MLRDSTKGTLVVPTAKRRTARLALALLGAGLLLLATGGQAAAEVTWQVSSVHGDQHMVPGRQGQYVVQAANIGSTPTSTPYTISDTLPAGVTVPSLAEIPSDVTNGGRWDCSATAFPDAGVVRCTSAVSLAAVLTSFDLRGYADPLILNVDVPGSMSGTVANDVEISGGSPTAAPATTSDPTVFGDEPPGFGFVAGSFAADVFDASFPGGTPVRQAGSHPFEARVDFDLNLKLSRDAANGGALFTETYEGVRTLETKLPAGLIGNPQAVPQCDPKLLLTGGANFGGCPANTQVGSIDLSLGDGSKLTRRNATSDIPVFNMEPPPGIVAQFALTFVANPVFIVITLDPTDHYSVVATIKDTTELLALRSARLTLWGVPADPAHDVLRADTTAGEFGVPFTGAPIKPFLTLPSQCGVDGVTQMRADSWLHPGAFTPWQTSTPAQVTGCDDPRFRFNGSVSLQPTVRTPSSPTGLEVEVSVDLKDDEVASATDLYSDSGKDVAIATPPLRNVTVLLPAGMSVSPSSANGLLGCSTLQIGLGDNDDPSCPDGSKIGTVTIDTPLLAQQLQGSVYLAAQTDNPFGSLLAMYIAAKGPGVIIKLPGKIEPDLLTGRLTATFQDNPQVPFDVLRMHLKSGARSPLVTPAACGTYKTTSTMTSWNDSLSPVHAESFFTISGDGNGGPCAPHGFDPGFVAGTKSPVAGGDSPLVTRFSRTDADQELDAIDVTMPEGVLGRIADVPLCSNGAADAGTCTDASKIGRVTVAAGPGTNPIYITDGRVYITEGYKGAPFGLSIVVPAVAGPFDLGTVVVRAKILVDRRTAQLRVVSNPLPRILQGIPLQLRLTDVTVDRPGFTFNPTDCTRKSASADITSVEGAVARKTARFRVTNCAALPFRPAIRFTVGAKRRTGRGASTPLTTTLRMSRGQANIAKVGVTLPTTLNARLPVVNNACTLAEFHDGHCEDSRAGTVVVRTPLLRDPLSGGAYFVRNGKPLPDLILALRGQVDIDLAGRVTIPGSTRLATTFETVPDVPFSTFTLRLVAGKKGPIGTTTNLCRPKGRRGRVRIEMVGQNGARIRTSQRMSVSGCSRRAAQRRASRGRAGKR